MIRRVMVTLATLFLLACATAPAFAELTYMSCTFDDKTIDQPLGKGGPNVGEPNGYDADMQVIVRATPFDTPSIDIHNTELTGNRNIYFNVSTPAVSSGMVVIVADLWFYQTGPGRSPFFAFYSSNWEGLLRIEVRDDSSMVFTDTQNGDAIATVPTVPTGRSLPILVAINMDTDTYSAWVDQVQYVSDHALYTAGAAFYILNVASGWNCAADNHFGIDQIRVVDTVPEVSTQHTTWGKVRALFWN